MASRLGENRKEKTTWLNVEIWGRTAEVVEQYLVKGQEVSFIGEIETGSYEKDDGQRRYYSRMQAYQMELGAKPKGNGNPKGGVSKSELEDAMRKAINLTKGGVDEDTAIKAILQL